MASYKLFLLEGPLDQTFPEIMEVYVATFCWLRFCEGLINLL